MAKLRRNRYYIFIRVLASIGCDGEKSTASAIKSNPFQWRNCKVHRSLACCCRVWPFVLPLDPVPANVLTYSRTEAIDQQADALIDKSCIVPWFE